MNPNCSWKSLYCSCVIKWLHCCWCSLQICQFFVARRGCRVLFPAVLLSSMCPSVFLFSAPHRRSLMAQRDQWSEWLIHQWLNIWKPGNQLVCRVNTFSMALLVHCFLFLCCSSKSSRIKSDIYFSSWWLLGLFDVKAATLELHFKIPMMFMMLVSCAFSVGFRLVRA